VARTRSVWVVVVAAAAARFCVACERERAGRAEFAKVRTAASVVVLYMPSERWCRCWGDVTAGKAGWLHALAHVTLTLVSYRDGGGDGGYCLLGLEVHRSLRARCRARSVHLASHQRGGLAATQLVPFSGTEQHLVDPAYHTFNISC
jgi:hypothetical protein